MKIVVDVKEAKTSPEIVENLKKDAEILIDVLDAGDYLFPGVLVERKTVFGLANDIRSKRLWGQLAKLKDAQDVEPILLIEGSFTKLEKLTGWSPVAINGVLISILREWKIPQAYTPNSRWTTLWLKQLAKDLEPHEYKLRPLRVTSKPMSVKDQVRYVVEGLADVGPLKAHTLLTELGNIRNVANASVEQLKSIKGIGGKTAEKIHLIMNYQYNIGESH